MKVSICTFSGTGNTHITAKFIARNLENLRIDVSHLKIDDLQKNDERPELAGVDYLIIGYPIHAFNAPEIVMDFVARLPEGVDIKVAVFKTAGEPFYLNRSSSAYMKRILTRKGYDYMAEKHILMPYNILFRYEDALAKQMYLFMQDISRDFAQIVAEGRREYIKWSAFGEAMSFLFRHLEWFGARFNGKFYSYDRKECIMCLKCVRECPTNNIYVKNGKLRFGWKCAMCMRCVQVCPKDALRIGLVQPLKVRMDYDYEKLAEDESIPEDYVNAETRGYFRLFRKFFGVK